MPDSLYQRILGEECELRKRYGRALEAYCGRAEQLAPLVLRFTP